jgi:hypothetical protein
LSIRPSAIPPDPKRRSPGEAAIERPINSPTPERQAFPQAAWSHAQGAGPVADIGSASRAWRSRPRTTLDRPHPQNILVAPLVARQPRDALPARAFLSSVCFRTVQATIRMALIAAILEAAAAPITCPLRASRPAAPPGNCRTARHRPALRLDREKPLPGLAEGRVASLSGCYGKRACDMLPCLNA